MKDNKIAKLAYLGSMHFKLISLRLELKNLTRIEEIKKELKIRED